MNTTYFLKELIKKLFFYFFRFNENGLNTQFVALYLTYVRNFTILMYIPYELIFELIVITICSHRDIKILGKKH